MRASAWPGSFRCFGPGWSSLEQLGLLQAALQAGAAAVAGEAGQPTMAGFLTRRKRKHELTRRFQPVRAASRCPPHQLGPGTDGSE